MSLPLLSQIPVSYHSTWRPDNQVSLDLSSMTVIAEIFVRDWIFIFVLLAESTNLVANENHARITVYGTPVITVWKSIACESSRMLEHEIISCSKISAVDNLQNYCLGSSRGKSWLLRRFTYGRCTVIWQGKWLAASLELSLSNPLRSCSCLSGSLWISL